MTGSPDGSGEEPTGRAVRMSRSPGGRHRILGVRLTEEEESQIRRRADECGLSAQRFLVEAAMSGSATAATERRRARRDAERAHFVLASVSNNLNQLAKWANSSHDRRQGQHRAAPVCIRAGSMIAKVSRGSSGRGLIRYLFGPGRANEHTDQRVITAGLALGE